MRGDSGHGHKHGFRWKRAITEGGRCRLELLMGPLLPLLMATQVEGVRLGRNKERQMEKLKHSKCVFAHKFIRKRRRFWRERHGKRRA